MNRKRSIFITIFLWCMLIGSIHSALAQNQQRGLWVWSRSDDIIDDYNNNTSSVYEDFISFIEAPHSNPADRVTNLYLSCYTAMRSNPNEMRAFLADMSSRGFAVYVVLSDPNFVLPSEVVFFKDKIDKILLFQRKGIACERFAGIMLDIEPHLCTGLDWDDTEDNALIWTNYITELTYCRTQIDAYNVDYDPDISFSDSVASWYGTSLINDIVPQVNFYTVLAYSDTKETIVAIATEEMTAAHNAGIECVIGVETMPLPSAPTDTFYGEGVAAFEEALDYLDTTYSSETAYGGVAIHLYANPDDSEEGYQNLTKTASDDAPVVTITSPNGVQVEGISFEDSVTINWTVYNPDSKNYNITLSYKYQGDLGNNSVAWQSIHSLSDVSSSVSQGSYEWVTSITSSLTNRIIIKADVSYTSAPVLTTSDMTDFGVGINEIIISDAWSDSIYANYAGYPQGLQVISDNASVLHATYYMFYDTSDSPGVYYAQSADGGATWSSTHLTPNAYSLDGEDVLSSWPRRPSMAKYGDIIAIAWIEDSVQGLRSNGFSDKRVYLQINNDAGNSSSWMPAKILVSSSGKDIYSNVNVHVASDGSVHLTWEAYVASTDISSIEYAKYTYNSTSGMWETTGSQVVDQSASNDYVLRTPSVTTTNYGTHTIWSEYKKETTSTGSSVYIFNEDFDSYSVGQRVDWNRDISELYWQFYGGGATTISDSGGVCVRLTNSSGNGCGITPYTVNEVPVDWDPPKDLTNGTISIAIRTNLTSAVANSVTAKIRATTTNAADPTFTTTFSLPSGTYATLPSASAGWQTLTFNVADLTSGDAAWAIPNFANVKQVQIVVGYTGVANIDFDNFSAQGFGATAVPPEVRIVTRTKTTSWQSAKEVTSFTYSAEQLLSGVDGNFLNYPVYFPKITALGNYTYAVWQLTTVGTPGISGLEQYSSVQFSKRDVSSTLNNWDTATTIATEGYAPVISAWSNGSTPTVQVVYSNNFSEYITDEACTGNLLYKETTNQGTAWTGATMIVQGSGVANGIRRPYINNSYSGVRAVHFMSYPFIFSDENGLSTISWINGGQNGNGIETRVPEEYFKVRGLASFTTPNPPFANLTSGGGFTISWNPPDIQYAPTGYKLRRIPDNNTSMMHEVNSGNPIYAISYYDNDSITAGVHYRYELSYMLDDSQSPCSALSNVVKENINLMIDDFEHDGSSQTYTGMTYSFFNAYKPITGVITSEQASSGSNSYKITYTDNDTTVSQGALASLVFPTTMDFSAYGSLNLSIRFNSEAGMIVRDVDVQLVEAETGETFRIGTSLTLLNDSQWHTYHLFFDQVSPEVNGVSGATLDLEHIQQINFVTWGNGSTSYYIDNLSLSPTTTDDVLLYLDTEIITVPTPISYSGMTKAEVVNPPLTPVTVYFGNAEEPWILCIYTASEMKNKAQQTYPLTRHGLVRYDPIYDNVYPEYTLPLKVWCGNYGPVGFFNSQGNIANSSYAAQGYPPVTNDYFLKGYDLDNDGTIGGLLFESDGPFIEGTGAGEYPFDLDGDGFQQGDNFFDPADGRVAIGEEPAWLFVPVLQHATEPAAQGAIVMDPSDTATWRVLTSSEKGAGTHYMEMYFAVFIGEEQLVNSSAPNARGQYRNTIIVDLAYN